MGKGRIQGLKEGRHECKFCKSYPKRIKHVPRESKSTEPTTSLGRNLPLNPCCLSNGFPRIERRTIDPHTFSPPPPHKLAREGSLSSLTTSAASWWWWCLEYPMWMTQKRIPRPMLLQCPRPEPATKYHLELDLRRFEPLDRFEESYAIPTKRVLNIDR